MRSVPSGDNKVYRYTGVKKGWYITYSGPLEYTEHTKEPNYGELLYVLFVHLYRYTLYNDRSEREMDGDSLPVHYAGLGAGPS